MAEPVEPALQLPPDREESDLFRLLVSSVQDYAIFLLDPTGRISSWNEGAARIKGYSAQEIIGKHFSVFYAADDVSAGKPDWELVVAADVGRFEDEGWRVRKDGSRFWANVVITALRDSTGGLRGFGKVTRDLTLRRQAEIDRLERERREADVLRSHAARLAELEKAKADFLNLASHELRGPLAVARGYVSMVIDGSLQPAQFLEVAPIVQWKLAQMEGLVGKMLETARLDYDHLHLSIGDVNLPDLARQQVEKASLLLTPAHRMTVDYGSDPELMVRGDRDRLASVVWNLLENAIKYSPEGGAVHVLVTHRMGRAFVSIADTGIGIEQEDFPRLFTRFTRLEHPATTSVGGTGLGLFLSREIARRHSGDILVESTPGKGSRFTLSLPLKR